jgi:hypothetical protein
LVSNEYPELEFRTEQARAKIHIEGTLRLRTAKTGVPCEIALRIELREGYPKTEPIAFDVGHRCEWGDPDGHVNPDGAVCLWIQQRSQWNPSEPLALVEFIAQVIVFFERYLVYEAGGKLVWPGPASGHGVNGYLEYLREELKVGEAMLQALAPELEKLGALSGYAPCPCGADEVFRRCHGPQLRRLRRTLDPWNRRRIVSALLRRRSA